MIQDLDMMSAEEENAGVPLYWHKTLPMMTVDEEDAILCQDD